MIIKTTQYHGLRINLAPAIDVVIIDLRQPMPHCITQSVTYPTNGFCRKCSAGISSYATIPHRLHSIVVVSMALAYCAS